MRDLEKHKQKNLRVTSYQAFHPNTRAHDTNTKPRNNAHGNSYRIITHEYLHPFLELSATVKEKNIKPTCCHGLASSFVLTIVTEKAPFHKGVK
jgi:hypothetical protein